MSACCFAHRHDGDDDEAASAGHPPPCGPARKAILAPGSPRSRPSPSRWSRCAMQWRGPRRLRRPRC